VESDMAFIADNIDRVLMNADDVAVLDAVKAEVNAYMAGFPLYPELG
jgi:glycine hydroxymethyltransferase